MTTNEQNEIRKAAECLVEVCGCVKDEMTVAIVSDLLGGFLEQDRKRHDTLEDALVELKNNQSITQICIRVGVGGFNIEWFVCGDRMGKGTGWKATPTEAARAALDELKGKGDA